MMLALRVEAEAEPAGEDVFQSEVIATLGVLRQLRAALQSSLAAPSCDDGLEQAVTTLQEIRAGAE